MRFRLKSGSWTGPKPCNLHRAVSPLSLLLKCQNQQRHCTCIDHLASVRVRLANNSYGILPFRHVESLARMNSISLPSLFTCGTSNDFSSSEVSFDPKLKRETSLSPSGSSHHLSPTHQHFQWVQMDHKNFSPTIESTSLLRNWPGTSNPTWSLVWFKLRWTELSKF